MKQSFIVFKIEAGQLVPHDHPVFMGQVSYDLPGSSQGIPVDPDYNCREFTSTNEVAQAIGDYMRQDRDPVTPSPFYVLQKCSLPIYNSVKKIILN